MALSLFHPLPNPSILFPHPDSSPKHYRLLRFATNCSSDPSSPPPPPPLPVDFPSPPSETTIRADKFPIEKRRRSEIIRERKQGTAVSKPEPPNFEIGWKRTKATQVEKPTGHVIMDFLGKLEELMGKEYGSAELLAKAAEIVVERAVEEAEVLMEEGKVEERVVRELMRVLKLMEMDVAMVKAAVKEETVVERVEEARARCRQAILVANSF